MSRAAHVAAPAKVNLYLRVLERRPDGYHELATLFQAIDLADDVTVELGGDGVHLEVSGPDLGPTEENLAHRAAVRLCAELGLPGARVSLTKRIPVGAGLGGGSSDAAAVLAALGALVGIARDDPRLHRIATELGSDVAFFVGRSALALGRGRGELLESLPPLPTAALVLVSPPVHVSTAAAYGALAAERRARGAGTPAAPVAFPRPSSWSEVIAAAHNDFEPVVGGHHPEVARSLAALREAGAAVALLSGSGATSFGVFGDEAEAESVARRLETRLGWPCRVARTLTTLPEPRIA